MNIPNPRETRVSVFVDRYFLSYLVDTDGAALVDTDDALLGVMPLVRDPVEITDRVRSGRVSLGDVRAVGSSHAGVDSTVAVLNLVLDHGDPSLAPGAQSVLNQPDELLRPYRPIRVVAQAEGGPEVTIFSGYLGDEIRSSASAGAATITVTARDLAKPLQDMFLNEFPILAGDASPSDPVPVDDVLQELLALVPARLRPPFSVADPVSFVIREPYRPQNCSVWDAMQQLALQCGWYLGVIGETLVFLDPPRDKVTPDFLFDTDDAFTDDLGISDTDVRNVVRVVFTEASSRERKVVEARDQWSIDNITGGIEKLSVLELDETSQIGTVSEAEALAARFISDMGREFASTQLNLPLVPELWLFDVIQMSHPKFTQLPRTFATHSVQHTWDRSRRRTVVAGVGQVIGKRRAWLNREPRPGSPNDPRGPHQSVLPPPIVVVEPGNPGFVVNVDHRRGVDAEWVQIHWSLVPGFIPGPASLKAEGTQEKWVFSNTDVSKPDHVIPGVPHYIRVRSIDSQGVPGRWTQEITVTPTKVDPAAIVLDSDVEVHGDVRVFGQREGGGNNTGTLTFFLPGSDPDVDDPVFAVGNVGGLHGAPPGFIGASGGFGTGIWIEGQPWLQAVLEPNGVRARAEFLNQGPFTRGDVTGQLIFTGNEQSFSSLNLPQVPLDYATIAVASLYEAVVETRPSAGGAWVKSKAIIHSLSLNAETWAPGRSWSWFNRGLPSPPPTHARLHPRAYVLFLEDTPGQVDIRVTVYAWVYVYQLQEPRLIQ